MQKTKRLSLYTPTQSTIKRQRFTMLSSTRDSRGMSTSDNISFKSSRLTHQPSPFNINTIQEEPQKQNYSLVMERLSTNAIKSVPPPKELSYSIRDKILKCISSDNQMARMRLPDKDNYCYYCVDLPNFVYGFQMLHHQISQTHSQWTQRKQQDGVDFAKGYLNDLGYLYYAVENTLFFQNIREMVHFKTPGQMVKMILQKPIIKVMECKFNSETINQNIRQQILIVSHPFQLRFFSYEIDHGKLLIEDLDLRFQISHTQCIDKIVVSKAGHVFYLDASGKLNRMIDRQHKSLFLFPNGKYTLDSYRYDPSILEQIYDRHKDENFLQHLKFFTKSVYDRFQRYLVPSITNKSLVIDEKRQIIFSLICKNYNDSKQHEIICYTVTGSHLSILNSITEKQLFKVLSSIGVILYEQAFTIRDIMVVQSYFDTQSCLQVILENSTRIFLTPTKYAFRYIKILYPPSFQYHAPNSNLIPEKGCRIQSYHSSSTVLKAFLENNVHQCLFLLQLNDSLLSFLVSKADNTKESMVVAQIKWKSLEDKKPEQCLLHYVSPEIYCAQYHKNFLEIASKYAKGYQWEQLHVTATQIFMGPHNFILNVEDSIEFMMKLRPIDLLYSIISTLGLEQSKVQIDTLSRIWKKPEISCMLICLLTNQENKYFQSRVVEIEILKKGKKRQAEMQQRKTDVQIVQLRQFSEMTKSRMSEILNYVGATRDKREDKQENNSSKNYNGFSNNYNHYTTPMEEGLVLYLARTLRFILQIPLKQITMQNSLYIQERLHEIKKFLEQNTANFVQSFSEDKQNLQTFNEIKDYVDRCLQVLELTKIIFNFPQNLTFSEALYKDNRYFEPFLFVELAKQDRSVTKNWKTRIPSYINEKFITFCMLFYKIAEIQDTSKILDLISKHSQLPKYFVQYLEKYKHISTAQYLKIQRTISDKIRQKLLKGNLQEKYVAALQLLQQSDHIQKKILYSDRAYELLKEIIETKKLQQIDKHKLDLQLQENNQRKKKFRLQKLLIEYVTKQPELNRQKHRGEILINQLQKEEFSKKAIKQLVDEMDYPLLRLIYSFNFTSSDYLLFNQDLSSIINMNKLEWPTRIESEIKKMFEYVEVKFDQLDGTIALLEGQNQKQQPYKEFYKNIDKFKDWSIVNKNKKPFWLPQLLLAVGYTDKSIFDHYMKKVEFYNFDSLDIKDQEYWWLSTANFLSQTNSADLIANFNRVSKDYLAKFQKYSQHFAALEKISKTFEIIK